MADRPQLPPPNVMIPELRTANPINTIFRELVDRTTPRWQQNNPIARGMLYSDLQGSDVNVSKAFPTLYFLSETVPIGSNTVAGMTQHDYVIWNWATEPEAESSYNAEISYLGDSVTNPVFARVRTVRRDVYDNTPSIATGTPYTGLIGVEITVGGSGYKKAEAEYDCYGEDAEIRFVISKGAIISGIVLKSGTGFNLGSVINIIGDGSGAECVPIIQPVAAILTSQKKVEFPDDDPRSNEFVKSIEVYELLPGPWVSFTRYDDNLGPIQGRRRAVLNTGQRGGVIGPTAYRNYEGRDGSSVVLIEIEERFSNGSGIPGPGGEPNPTYPILAWSTYEQPEGRIDHTSQLFGNEFAGHQATFVRPGGGIVIKTWFEPYQDNPANLVHKLIDTWTEVVINDQATTSEHGGGIKSVTERTNQPGVQSPDTGLLVVKSELRTVSPNEQIKHSEILTGATAWPINIGRHTDEKTGIVVNYTKQVIDAGTPYPGTTPQSDDCALMKIQGPFVEDQPYDRWKTIRIVSAVDLNTLPKPQCWGINHPVNFPPQLLSIEAIWSDAVSKLTSAQAGSARVAVSTGSGGGVIVTSRTGYRGYAQGIQQRTYFYGPPNVGLVPYPLKIKPSSGTVILTQTSSRTAYEQGCDGGIEFSDAFQLQLEKVDIRDHLVGFYNVTNQFHQSPPQNAIAVSGCFGVAAVSAFGTSSLMEIRLPFSTPTQLNSGSLIVMEAEVNEWRFGVWVLDVISVYVP